MIRAALHACLITALRPVLRDRLRRRLRALWDGGSLWTLVLSVLCLLAFAEIWEYLHGGRSR